MSRLTDIRPGKVGQVVQNFLDGGSTKITAWQQADGNWSVEAEQGHRNIVEATQSPPWAFVCVARVKFEVNNIDENCYKSEVRDLTSDNKLSTLFDDIHCEKYQEVVKSLMGMR